MLAPVSVTETSTVDPKRRAELLSDRYAMNRYFSASFPQADFRARIETWKLPDIAVTKQFSDANTIIFTAGLSDHVADLLYVRLSLEGTDHGFVGGERYVARQGDVTVLSSRDVGAISFSKRRTIAVYVPRQAIAGASSHSLPTVISGKTPLGRLLGGTLKEFDRALPATLAHESGMLGACPVHVLRALLGVAEPDLARTDIADAQRQAIKAFIDDRIGVAPVTAEVICTAFGLSRATLYRLFHEERGIESLVARRRLLRVFGDLALAPERRGEVTRIAERWQFYDPSNFAAQFCRCFNVLPSDVLGCNAMTEPSPDPQLARGLQSRMFSDVLDEIA